MLGLVGSGTETSRASAHLLSSKAVILILSMLASMWALARTLTSPLVATCEVFHRFFPWPSLPAPHQSERSWMADGVGVGVCECMCVYVCVCVGGGCMCVYEWWYLIACEDNIYHRLGRVYM